MKMCSETHTSTVFKALWHLFLSSQNKLGHSLHLKALPLTPSFSLSLFLLYFYQPDSILCSTGLNGAGSLSLMHAQIDSDGVCVRERANADSWYDWQWRRGRFVCVWYWAQQEWPFRPDRRHCSQGETFICCVCRRKLSQTTFLFMEKKKTVSCCGLVQEAPPVSSHADGNTLKVLGLSQHG